MLLLNHSCSVSVRVGLSIRDRFAFCLAPVNVREPEVVAALKR